MVDEEFVLHLPQLLTADGALATLEAMAGSLRIDVHEQRLQGHLQSILAERQKGTLPFQPHSIPYILLQTGFGTQHCNEEGAAEVFQMDCSKLRVTHVDTLFLIMLLCLETSLKATEAGMS